MLMVYFLTSQHRYPSLCQRRKTCLNILKIAYKLAHGLLSKTCANLIEFVKNVISSPEFLNLSRKSQADFSRNRKLPFLDLLLYLLNFVKSSYQPELNKFFQILSGSLTAKKIVSKAALCKARKKLKHESFVELNARTVDHFYQHFSPLKWMDFTLKVIDGSTVKLPDYQEIAEHFGAWHPRQGGPVSMARISQLYDPLNQVTTHAIIAPKSVGERELAARHCELLGKSDLVLLDRGYPAFWLFVLILRQGTHFCARISTKKWHIIRRFMALEKSEQVITLTAPATSIAACKERCLDTRPIQVRLIRIELDSGETEVLITSLLDPEEFPAHLFAELYHTRWPVEEDYKVMKCRIEIEDFSGQSVHSVYQDFHAAVFSKNITAMLVFSTRESVEKLYDQRQLQYKINFTQALSTMRDAIVLLFQRSKRALVQMLHDLLETIAMAVEPVRPGRKYPRNHKRSQRKFSLCYKRTL